MGEAELQEKKDSMSIEMLQRFIERMRKDIANYPARKRKLLEQLNVDMQRERAWLKWYKQALIEKEASQ
jgi:hypothetical protein